MAIKEGTEGGEEKRKKIMKSWKAFFKFVSGRIFLWAMFEILRGKQFFHLFKNCIHITTGVDTFDTVELLIVIHNWHSVIDIGVQSFSHRFNIIIGTARSRLATFQATFDADLFGTLEEEDKFDIHFILHRSLPAIQIVLISGKAIDQKVTNFMATSLGQWWRMLEHRFLQ